MSYHVVDAPQRSALWFAARCGRVTASRAKDVLASIKSGEAAARRDYRIELVVERITQQPAENGFVSADMERGIALEADAFAAYESETGAIVERVGFLAHDYLLVGGSPDGLIGDVMRPDGLIEIKVPRSATHLRYLRSGALPSEHAAQVMHLLWLTDAPWLDFFSFDPRFPAGLQTFRVRVARESLDLASYAAKLSTFLGEVNAEYADVSAMRSHDGE